MINNNAPIIPWEGMGWIKLYSSFKELREVIEDRNTKATLIGNHWVRYEVEGSLYLFFELINGKLFKITTLCNYKGKLFENIGVGTLAKDFLQIEPSFIYDDFEEVYISKDKGIFIETDVETNSAQWISVFVKEMFDDDFEEANW